MNSKKIKIIRMHTIDDKAKCGDSTPCAVLGEALENGNFILQMDTIGDREVTAIFSLSSSIDIINFCPFCGADLRKCISDYVTPELLEEMGEDIDALNNNLKQKLDQMLKTMRVKNDLLNEKNPDKFVDNIFKKILEH